MELLIEKHQRLLIYALLFSIFSAIIFQLFLCCHLAYDVANFNWKWLMSSSEYGWLGPYTHNKMDYGFTYALLLKICSILFVWHSPTSPAYCPTYYMVVVKLVHYFITQTLLVFYTYKIVKTVRSHTTACLASIISLWCPLYVYDTCWWGQTDVLIGAMLLASFYHISQEKLKTGVLWFTLALTIKATCIYFLPPLLLYLYLTERSFKCLWVIAGGLLAYFVATFLSGLPAIQFFKIMGRQYSDNEFLWYSCTPNLAHILQLPPLEADRLGIRLSFIPNSANFEEKMWRFFLVGFTALIFVCTTLALSYKRLLYKLSISHSHLFMRMLCFFGMLFPYCMPKQYGRYFIVVGVIFNLVYPFFNPKRVAVAILTVMIVFSNFCFELCNNKSTSLNETVKFIVMLESVFVVPAILYILAKDLLDAYSVPRKFELNKINIKNDFTQNEL